jgi:transcriptional regulator with XRE-family HTH domain
MELLSTENIDNLHELTRQHKMLIMLPEQCKAARSLLGMTQPQLAEASGLGLSTVVDFERDRRTVSPEAVQAMRDALKRAGVIFVEENGAGPGVRLKKAKRKGK